MESNGTTGRILISETTKNILERDKNLNWRFEYNKTVDIKHYGQIKAYLIEDNENINQDE